MAYINSRRLPVGIQSFKKIREDKFLYIDKSDIIWQLANNGTQYNYLCRPRRFGKSVLVDTLKAYFEGRRDLFEGLKIMDIETEWKQYPVIRLDMSRGGASADSVRSYFNTAFKAYEEEYGIVAGKDDSLSVRFNSIIMAAYRKTGMQVARSKPTNARSLHLPWNSTAKARDCWTGRLWNKNNIIKTGSSGIWSDKIRFIWHFE